MLLLLAAIVAAPFAGCSKKRRTTIINEAGDLVSDDFPGSSAAENSVGDDGFGFANSGAILNKGLNVFWNASTGEAIVLYPDRGSEALFAHFFDGSTFTPPVELIAPNQSRDDEDDDEFVTLRDFRVLFLNTAVQGRSGDALILWVREERPGLTDPNAEANDRLFGTYFDRSQAGIAANADASVRFGFTRFGTAIDFETVLPAASDGEVTTCGFVSDSLVGSHIFEDRASLASEIGMSPGTVSGDPTTAVFIAWRKAVVPGTAERIHALEFDLTQVGNALPVESAAGAALIAEDPAFALAAGSAVGAEIVAHDLHLLWVGSTATTTSILLTRFDTGTTTTSTTRVITSPGGATATLPRPSEVYGGDHGLTSLYVAFRDVAQNLVLAKSDLDAALAVEVAEIDAGVGAVSAFGTRIARDGAWILAAWLEGATAQARARAIQTRRDGTARTLAQSLSAALLAPNQAAAQAAERLQLQSELADGTTLTTVGFQSDLLRMNYCFQQPDDLNTNVQSLIHNGVRVTLGGAGVAPSATSTVTGALPAGLVDQVDVDYQPIGGNMRAVMTDLGSGSGAPLLFYLRNENNATSSVATGAFDEVRVFAAAGVDPAPAPALVSTNGQGDDSVIGGEIEDGENDDFTEGTFLRIHSTPRSTAAGALAGTTVHLFWVESQHVLGSPPSLRTRLFQKASFNPTTSSTFATAFAPALTAAPVALDGDAPGESGAYIMPTVFVDGDEAGPRTDFVASRGTEVGIFFRSSKRFLFNRFDGASWQLNGGLGAPTAIDFGGLFPGRDQQAHAFTPRRSNTADGLSGTLCFFLTSSVATDNGNRRSFARVLD